MSEENNKTEDKDYYIEGVGRRKTSTARVRIYPNDEDEKGEFTVNGRELEDYFPTGRDIQKARAPFDVTNKNFKVTVQAKGGGNTGQAEAIQLGLARALVEFDEEWKPKLKKEGHLTRDARMKERKKPGLRSARRPQQWRKR